MAEHTVTPSRLWKSMTPEQRQAVARAFWLDEEAADDQIQAVMLISQRKKFRPKSVLALDLDRKTRHLASIAVIPDQIVGRALIVYHLAEQRPMMGAFLDALGVKHENGLIDDDTLKPDPEKIAGAVARLTAEYPKESVTLYLNTLLCQDPETWGALADLPELQSAS
ncbi:MAG TPA: hypothetical protein VJP86_13875 [Vicinamibacterales bacterium]|nr:hypothetical protein [Vicinamibacterales bacterium]